MGAELCADRRTDMTKLMVAFRSSSNAPKIFSNVPYVTFNISFWLRSVVVKPLQRAAR